MARNEMILDPFTGRQFEYSENAVQFAAKEINKAFNSKYNAGEFVGLDDVLHEVYKHTGAEPSPWLDDQNEMILDPFTGERFELFIEFDEESILYDELERNLELNLLF